MIVLETLFIRNFIYKESYLIFTGSFLKLITQNQITRKGVLRKK